MSLKTVIVKILRHLTAKVLSVCDKALTRLDISAQRKKRVVAVTLSLLLHLGVLLLMLPSPKGFLSVGTTGLGDTKGAGTAVTLVDASEITPSQATQELVEAPTEEQTEPAKPPTEPEVVDTAVSPEPTEAIEPVKQPVATTEQQAVSSDSLALSYGAAQATGATGQSGQADSDLWSAIAPCWNRIADAQTLGATLTISFSPEGGLSAPPVIERDPTAPITEQSLQSEAKALAALAECGAYPMAKGLQAVTVAFPPAAKVPAPGHKAMTSHQSHLLFQYLFKADQR